MTLDRTGHFWGEGDQATVLAVMTKLQPGRVLEFGPGFSTLALLDGGARHIDCCEDTTDWRDVWKERLRAYNDRLRFVDYAWSDPISVPELIGDSYDLALVDAPFDTTIRRPVIEYCLDHSAAVLVPLEVMHGDGLRWLVTELAETRGLQLELIESGPVAGAFGLLTR